MTLHSEVVDGVASLEDFIEMNKITQEQLKCVIVVWKEND